MYFIYVVHSDAVSVAVRSVMVIMQVEWSEINMAWGQTVLLLHSLANKMSLQFERWHIFLWHFHFLFGGRGLVG